MYVCVCVSVSVYSVCITSFQKYETTIACKDHNSQYKSSVWINTSIYSLRMAMRTIACDISLSPQNKHLLTHCRVNSVIFSDNFRNNNNDNRNVINNFKLFSFNWIFNYKYICLVLSMPQWYARFIISQGNWKTENIHVHLLFFLFVFCFSFVCFFLFVFLKLCWMYKFAYFVWVIS